MIQIIFFFVIQCLSTEYDGYKTMETKLEFLNRMINNVKDMIDSKSFERSKEILSTLVLIDEEISNIERDYNSIQKEIQKQSRELSSVKQQLESLYENFPECSLPKLKANQKGYFMRNTDFNANISLILGFIFAVIIFVSGLCGVCLVRSICCDNDENEEDDDEKNKKNNDDKEIDENKPKSN